MNRRMLQAAIDAALRTISPVTEMLTSVKIRRTAPGRRPLARWTTVPVMWAMAGLVAFGGLAGPLSGAATAADELTIPAAESPLATCPAGGQCFADVLPDNPFYEFINRLYQKDIVSGYACGGAGEPCDAESRPYYRPSNTVTRQQMAKFVDQARRQPGIHIDTATPGTPIYARSTAAGSIGIVGQGTGAGIGGLSEDGAGVWGHTDSDDHGGPGVIGVSDGENGTGVYGVANDGFDAYGVWGTSTGGIGVYGTSDGGNGVRGVGADANWSAVSGRHEGAGVGVYGISASGLAGRFLGDVEISGACCGASGGSFRMDHPLNPANKYLYHSAVASQEMLNVYNGNVTLDGKGEAWVRMPDWFEAVNLDFRYQLTSIGAPGPDLYVAEKVQANRFKIAGGQPGAEVSWQVTGVRHDAYAEANRIPVEVDKPQGERGMYIHPELYGRPDSETIGMETGR